MYRKTYHHQHTLSHSYKILLFDSQNSAFSPIRYTRITKHSPTCTIECRAFTLHVAYLLLLACLRGTRVYVAYIQRRMPVTLHYRERRKHFTIAYNAYYNNRVGNSFYPCDD